MNTVQNPTDGAPAPADADLSTTTLLTTWRSADRRRKSQTRKRRAINVALVIASFIGAALLWDLLRLVGVLPTQFFPPVFDIVSRLFSELGAGFGGKLLVATGQTAVTWLLAFLIASVLGVVIGLLVGNSPYASATLAPLLRFVRSTPAVAFVPAAILVAGIGLQAKLLIVVFAGIWPIVLNTAAGVRHVPPQYRDVAKAARLSPAEGIRQVLLPTIAPSIVSGLRVSMSLTLAVTVGVDLLIGASGLGALINQFRGIGNITSSYAGILWAGLLGTVLNLVLIAVERKVLFWSPEYRRKNA